MHVCIHGENIFTQNQPNPHNLVVIGRRYFQWMGDFFVVFFSKFFVWDLRNSPPPPTYPAIGFISFPSVGGSFCPGLKTQFIYLGLLQIRFESTEGWWRDNISTNCMACCSFCRVTMWKKSPSSFFSVINQNNKYIFPLNVSFCDPFKLTW